MNGKQHDPQDALFRRPRTGTHFYPIERLYVRSMGVEGPLGYARAVFIN